MYLVDDVDNELFKHTEGSTITSTLFSHEVMKIWKNKSELHVLIRGRWTDQKRSFLYFLLHNWSLKESVHEKLIFTPIGIRITVGVSTLVVGTGCTHFNYKIYIRIGWEFFSPHRTLSLIEYLDHIVQNSRIKISVDAIPDFRSDSWEKWSTSYQYRVDFVDAMTFKIHERSKKYSKYCTPNESIATLAWQWT